jgi:hypothetical protein
MEEQFEKAEIFDTPQQLAASMQADAQPTQEAPQQESQPVSEPFQEQIQEQTNEPVQQEEFQYQATTDDLIEEQASTDNDNTTQQYSDNDIESAVFNYVSERLGREVKSFEDFSQPQNAMDERIQKIAEFVQRHRPRS